MLRDSLVYMYSLHESGDFPVGQLTPKMAAWRGIANGRRGTVFAEEVAKAMHANGWYTEVEVKVTKLLGKASTNVKRFESTPLALKELEAGGVDAVVADNGVVVNYVANNTSAKFKTVSDSAFTPEQYGIAVKKGNKDPWAITPYAHWVLDLLFVMKDADGTITTLEASDVGEEGAGFLSIDVTHPGALGPDDAEEVADDLPANSSALLIAYENLWVGKVVEALRDADAVLIDSIRIPVEVVEAFEAS